MKGETKMADMVARRFARDRAACRLSERIQSSYEQSKL